MYPFAYSPFDGLGAASEQLSCSEINALEGSK